MIAPLLSIKNLSHRYGEQVALENVSFEVQAGQIFGFLGPNGGGKTTLFRILSTALYPSQGGECHFNGINLLEQPDEIRKSLGVVFQSPSLDKKLSVEENLKYQGYFYGLSGKALRERMSLILGHVGLYDRRRDRVENLSGGLKKRAEIAKALLHEPRILLLDEPTTGLDPGARVDLWRYLKKLKEEDGITCLVTTHLMEEAERCDDLGILHKGRLVARGTPDALKQRIGGEVLKIKAVSPARLKQAIYENFKIPSMMVDQALYIETSNAGELMKKIKETCPDEIDAVTISKPSLEDVFIQVTGHQFWEPS